ncbi:DDB1- and CUL4-associated factor 1 [Patella vulgata]|uniref:DDB1- and CUL4-associated factor 1 n=1 Tax=Patella vulgata TaxID=6465 RepID=UPI0021807427|nr:DDB1- and CUL4-associated factor 1 [Patella vulgata]
MTKMSVSTSTSNEAEDLVSEFTSLLEKWGTNQASWNGETTVKNLKRLAEIIEIETEAFYKLDLDPFDDRHPDRADPTCGLGKVLVNLSKNERFMNELVGNYIMRSREDIPLQTAACRLLLDVMPGVEASILFQETEGLTEKIFQWAELGSEPLRSYATGLFAVAIKLPEISIDFREKNAHLVPIMLRRLHKLCESQSNPSEVSKTNKRHFSEVSKNSNSKDKCLKKTESENLPGTSNDSNKKNSSTGGKDEVRLSSFETSENLHKMSMKENSSATVSPNTQSSSSLKRGLSLSPRYNSDDFQQNKKSRNDSQTYFNSELTCSNSSWLEMEHFIIGSYSMEPLSVTMKQRIILQYLTPMGEYQDLLGFAFEYNAMDLIIFYIDLKKNTDVRLAFEALKYLATLLCHKKFAIEFLQRGGIEKLITINRPSIAATGVSLCLYFMSYFEDALERVCLLPEHILVNLVEYALWLLECSHDSSRIHAAMFFSQTFPFKVMLDLFDQQNGLRHLFNAISTLALLNVEDNSENLSEDYVFTMRQTARHVCGAMRMYFDAHMIMKAEEIKRSHDRSDEHPPVHETASFRPVKISEELIEENIELLSMFFPIRSHWTPVITFQKLGGIHLLLQLISMAPDWNSYPGRPETVKAALDVLAVCTVTPRAQSVLLETICLPNDVKSPAISIIIGLAEGETLLIDADVQRSALTIIVNCVCSPIDRFGGGVGRFMGSGSKKRLNTKGGEDILTKMWNAVRTNNGVMALLKLLSVKTPITDADAIRALSCKALVGLSRSETLRQIISKLPLFNNGQLQLLMKEPVLQDKRQEHIRFCKYACDLLEKVSGKQSKCVNASLEEIRRSDIVSKTKIIFQEKELLQLICGHLLSKGYPDSANLLRKEAKLPAFTSPSVVHIAAPNIFSPSTSSSKFTRQLSASASISAPTLAALSPTASSTTVPTPIKFTMGRNLQTSQLNTPKPGGVHGTSKSKYIRDCREKDTLAVTPAPSVRTLSGKSLSDYDISLDKIVTEYLRKQHALCPNPVVTCPPMSLFSPHQCPEPRGQKTAPINFTTRYLNRSIYPRNGGLDRAKYDRKLIYSRFRPVKTFKDTEDDGFACCALTSVGYLLLGTFSGEIKMCNIYTEELGIYSCHSSPVIHLDPSTDGNLLLTSTWGTMQDSSLWAWVDDTLENRFTFDDTYAEFSKITQDKIIGTKDETAHIYDTATGQLIMTLYDTSKANNYKSNIATFSPCGDLVLNDGVLWDVRSTKPIHKFDKFNPSISGVFHPMGLEVIINSEVWDVRTFHLLHTVPALDQCQIQFNYSGDVIYATHFDEDPSPEDRYRSPYSSTLRTFDSTDYTHIGTKDLKTKSIFDLSTDKSDCYLAVVENQKFSERSGEESLCRLYEVGKRRDDEEDQPEEEEEKGNDDDDDEDDDDDDDDDDDEEDVGDDNIGSDDDLELDDLNGGDDLEGIEYELDDEDDDDDVDDDADDVILNLNDLSSENSEDDNSLFQLI